MDTILLASWLSFISVVLFFIAFDISREPDKSFIRTVTGVEDKRDIIKILAGQIGPMVSPIFPAANMKGLEEKLIAAGEPYGLNAESFTGLKVLLLICGTVLAVFLSVFGIPAVFIPVFAVFFFLAPDYFLSNALEKRKKQINRDMPNMVGLLATAVKAGVELGPALEAVGNKMGGPLGYELKRAWKEMATGRPRASALKDMGKRTGVDVVDRFAEIIITASERGGMNLGQTLTNFMHDIRGTQSRKAQEMARKIPTKMLLPLVACILVPMMVILLTPIMFSLMEAF